MTVAGMIHGTDMSVEIINTILLELIPFAICATRLNNAPIKDHSYLYSYQHCRERTKSTIAASSFLVNKTKKAVC